MKKLIVALFASATALFASAKVLTQASFEVDLGGFSRTGGTLVRYDGDAPEECPYPFSSAGDSYCDIDADGETFDSPSSSAAYFDMNVKFTVRDSVNEGDLDGAKLAVYLNSENKIVVSSGDVDSPYVTDLEVDSSGWARLTIAKVTGGFKVYVDGGVVQENDEDKVFEPINNVGDTLQVAFDGKGALDNFVARTTDPFIEDIAATIGGEGYASLADALADDNGAPQLEANASYTIDSRGGSVGVKLNNHTLTVTAPTGLYAYPTTSGDVTTYTADYFPRTATAGQDGTAANPFEVADVDDLQALSAAVAADAATFAGKCYVQTADIDMTSAGAFAGIGTYAANLKSGVAFTGTYDGQRYKISNVDFTQRNYGGIFNQVKGGTIKNLTVENITCSTFDSSVNDGEWGCAIVGNAGLGAKLIGLTAAGSFGTAETPCSHNVAGIAIRVCGGASNVVDGVTMLETLVKNCTNNATLHGFYTKCAGITALTQDQNGVPNDYVLFDGCVNNANIAMVEATGSTLSKIGRDGLSGILSYVSDDTKIKDCVNNGTLTSALTTAKIGGIVGYAYNKTLEDLGGNANPAGQMMIGGTGSTITGFQYATVDNGVATTVTTLAKDTIYLLEGNVAASETPVFTLAAAGDTFKVDTALGYTFAGTVAVDTTTLVLAEPVTEGTVTTYEATAGVASVDDFAYATFAEAVAALEGATDDYVTLLADAETTLYAGDTLRVKTDGHFLTVNGLQDVIITDDTDGNDITTFAAVACVATFNGGQYASLSSAIDAWASAGAMVAYMNPVVLKADVDEDITIPVNVNAAVVPLQMTGSATINGTVTISAGATFQPLATVLFGGDVVVNGTLVRAGNATLSIGGDLTLADGATLGAFTLTANSPVYTVTGDVEVEGVLNISLTSATLEAGTYTVVTGAPVTRDEEADVVVYLNNVENDNWVLSGTSTELTITGAAATVDGEKFATFAEAAAAARGVETITLLASASYTLTVGEALIVEAGEFTMTVTPPAGYALVEGAVSAGVVAYTSQQYVAKLKNPNVGSTTYAAEVYYTSLKAALADVVEQTQAVYANYKAVVTLLTDDRVSFADGGQILIDKAMVLDGAGHAVYGKSAWTAAEINNVRDNKESDPTLVHGIKVVGSASVDIKNVAFTEFADATYCNGGCAYAVFAPSTYTGKLKLDGVQIDKFNRTAIDIRGGTFEITNCVVTCNATGMGSSFLVFQQPVQFLGAATGRVVDSTVTGFCANFPAGTAEKDLYDAGGIVSWSSAPVAIVDCTVTTDNAHSFGIESDGTGVVTISGTTVAAASSVGYWGDGTSVVITSGDYTGELYGYGNGSLAVSGGTFDRQVPAEFCADGKVPTTTPDAQGKYTVVDYVPPSGIDPASDEGAPIAVDTTKTSEEQAAEAQTKADAMDVQKTADAASVDQTTWNGYFTKTAEKVNDAWVAKAELNPAVVLPVDGAEETPLTEMLESVAEAAADATGKTAASVPTKAGLYYWIEGATDVGAASYTPGTAELGDGTEKPLARPTLTGENGKAFFKVCVGVAAPVKD